MSAGPNAERVQSLAGRLARTLILWVGGVWLLSVLGVAWYTDSEINHNFDNEIVEVAHRMFDIALQHLDQAPARAADAGPLILPSPGSFADADVLYQLVAPGEVAAFEALIRAGRSPLEAVCELADVDPREILGDSRDLPRASEPAA